MAGMWEVKPRRSFAVGERCVVSPGRWRGLWGVWRGHRGRLLRPRELTPTIPLHSQGEVTPSLASPSIAKKTSRLA